MNRCQSLTLRGRQCRQDGKVWHWHDGREYLACHQHHKGGFRPCKPGSVPAPAYRVTGAGMLEITSVPVIDGRPVDGYGNPLQSDGETVELMGWPGSSAESYCDGKLLIP